MAEFRAPVSGGELVGDVTGDGPEVLLLHGGPGLSDYLAPLAEELAPHYRVATYQQRGLEPSVVEGPVDVAGHVADVVCVLDHLGWDRPLLVGHSWGGNLMLHVVSRHPQRVVAAMSVDGLGAVGDGGYEVFAAEMTRRTPEESQARVDELEEQILAGTAGPEAVMEQLELVWPAYFADPASAPSMFETRIADRHVEMHQSMLTEMPGLAGRLSEITVPIAFLHGAGSPLPVSASRETAAAIGPAAYVEVVEHAGHFLWVEAPGRVLQELDRLRQRVE